MPFLEEFSFCDEWHWTWADCMRTPSPVLAYFLLYKNVRNQVSRYEAELAKRRAKQQAEDAERFG